MTKWLILIIVIVAISGGTYALASSDDSNDLRQTLAVKRYWVSEFRQRWKAERRTALKQAKIIWSLRGKNRKLNTSNTKLKTGMRSLQNAISSDPYGNHSLETGFLCIHGHEGSWEDPNSPYWGGLQMDYDFMETYGSEYLRYFGTADNWPVSVQIAVAIKAYISGRGYGPWPNTRLACGI